MSIAEKTRATLERGKENRGDFTPKSGSLPVKLYNYWLKNSGSKRAARISSGNQRENFCHYWRVVAFWAPLHALFNGVIAPALDSKVTWAVVGVIVAALLALLFVTVNGALVILLQCLAIVVGIALAIGVIVGISYVVAEVVPRKFPNATKKVGDFVLNPKFGGAVVGLVLAAIVYLTSRGHGVTGYVVWFCVGLVIALGGYVIVKLIDYLNGKAALKQDAWDALDWDTQDKVLDYIHAVNKTKRQPGKVAKFFSAIGNGIIDAVEFVVQVVRVNKWKICPLVEIPKETQDA